MSDIPKIDIRLLAEYAELKQEEKIIAKAMKELQPKIKESMRANDKDKVNTDFGSFTLISRNSWKYSDAVTELEDEEIANGTAKQVISIILYFSATKKSKS